MKLARDLQANCTEGIKPRLQQVDRLGNARLLPPSWEIYVCRCCCMVGCAMDCIDSRRIFSHPQNLFSWPGAPLQSTINHWCRTRSDHFLCTGLCISCLIPRFSTFSTFGTLHFELCEIILLWSGIATLCASYTLRYYISRCNVCSTVSA